jgi:phosphoribosylformylglycinamidine (FGAM) synthase PurS component
LGRLDQQLQGASIELIQHMCDPLLANSVINNTYFKKGKISILKPSGKSRKDALNDSSYYEIPDFLRKQPPNYNRYIPLKEIIPSLKPTENKKKDDQTPERAEVAIEAVDVKEAVPPKSVQIQAQTDCAQNESREKEVIDPLVMIKKYFNKLDNKSKAKRKNQRDTDPSGLQ